MISILPEDENFVRLNFYSKVRWRVSIDPTKHYFDSKFAIKTTVHKQADRALPLLIEEKEVLAATVRSRRTAISNSSRRRLWT